MLVDSHHKRPARMLALTMRFAMPVSLIVAATVVPARKWHAFSYEPRDVFLQSLSFIEAASKSSDGDCCECESEHTGDNNRTEARPGLSLGTSVTMIQAITRKGLEHDIVEEYTHDTTEEKNAKEDTPWPKTCVEDVRRCYLPIQQDPIAQISRNKNRTTVSNITGHVELEVDRVLRQGSEVDPIGEFEKKNIWSFFAFVDALI
jgi:hypothetical protein